MHHQHRVVDTWRTVLPTPQFGLYTLLPIPLLFILATTPVSVIGTRIKQIISLPLLASLVIAPYTYRDPSNGSFSAFCQIVPFICFLRFSDVFWITPVIYGKDSYISASELSAEFWSSIKVDAKSHHDKKKEDKKKVVHAKDRKFYHLFIPIILNVVVFDILAAYVKTFSEDDLVEMHKNHIKQYMVFFVAVVTALTCLLNLCGKLMQLGYCIVVDGGSYAAADWRNMMEYPLLGTSLEEIWSHRWHRILRPAWVSSAYKPVYFLVRKWSHENPRGKQLAIGLASMAVFVVSGLTHEFSVLCNAGWKVYKESYIGDQMMFFGIHGVLVVIEKTAAFVYKKVLPKSVIDSPLVKLLLHAYVMTVCFLTFNYFILGFAYWGLERVDTLTLIEHIARNYLASTPYLRQFCGSLI